MSKNLPSGMKIADKKFDRKASRRRLVVLAVLADFAASLTYAKANNTVQDVRPVRTSNSQQIGNPIRIAERLGFDGAIGRRDPVCINNDLRPECRAGQGSHPETDEFYVAWDVGAKRCFITTNNRIGSIIGGGPFQTWSAARDALKTIRGC